MSEEHGDSRGSAVAYGVLLFVLFYFLVPVVWLYPLEYLRKSNPSVRDFTILATYPLGVVANHVPLYDKLIGFELEACGLITK